MKQINTLSLLILFGSFSSTLLGMDFSFKEEIKGMSRQQCLTFRTKQLHQLKDSAIKEILETLGMSKKEFDEKIEEYKRLPDLYPLKGAYHDPTIPQEILSIVIKTLQEEDINPNTVTIKQVKDDKSLMCMKGHRFSKKNKKRVIPTTLYINTNLLKEFHCDFIKIIDKQLDVNEEMSEDIHNTLIKKSLLHEISHIKNQDYFVRCICIRQFLETIPFPKKMLTHFRIYLNHGNPTHFLARPQERIAIFYPASKSQKIAVLTDFCYNVTHTNGSKDYPPIEDLREWSTRFCDCWDLPEEKNS